MNVTCRHSSHAQNSAWDGWNDGTLAVADRPIALVCEGCAAYDAANPDPAVTAATTNRLAIEQGAQSALAANISYLNNAQAVGQVAALTRQVDGIIRILLNLLDSTEGT